jgi:type I restriction enzyme M protein
VGVALSDGFSLTPVDVPVRRRGRPRGAGVVRAPVQKVLGGVNGRQDLGGWLWGAADILRGAVRNQKYEDYVVPLLFFKRLSDEYNATFEEKSREFGGAVAGDSMFHRAAIPEGCFWEDIRGTGVNVGQKLNDALAAIARANPKLDGVLNRTDFNDARELPEERLVRLIEHFSGRNLANGGVTPDVLGDAYEYLLKKFNEEAPNRAGEFYTPREIVRVLVGCLKPEEGMHVYDPCCGSGGMLIESYYHLKREGKDASKLFLFGQEINPETWAMARMNVFLHGMEAWIEQGDTFISPKFLNKDGSLRQFDLVLANPMWNQDGFKRLMEDDQYGRFGYGVVNDSSADWGWIQHMLASLKPAGRMGVVLDQGALFRGGAEGEVRRKVVEADLVDCVVALPEKLFYNTGAPGCLIFLNKAKPADRRGKTLFVYAAEEYAKLSNMNQLAPEAIQHITSAFEGFGDEKKYGKVISKAEIGENDWNLSVTRYVDIYDEPEEIDIPKVWAQLKELEKQREVTNQKLSNYIKELAFEE